MKKLQILSNLKYILSLLLVFSIAAACSNSTSSDDDHDVHADAEGFVLRLNGQIIVQQLPDQNVTGEIELAPGEETDLITIHFYDHDGDEFQPNDDDVSLAVEFNDEGIVEFEQHAEDGKWSFHLHAEAEGVTDMRIKLMHGSHSDFTSQDIHVHVE